MKARLWVPGRIEVMGKHTDYAGGRSLVCAVNRGFQVTASVRRDREIRVHDVARNEEFRTILDPSSTAPAGSWGGYVATVAARIARDFPRARRGADIEFASDLPADAGLSSSSALVVAMALSLIAVNELESAREYAAAFPARSDLAGYLGAVENGLPFGAFAGGGGVGTFGGSEDHTAILCSREGHLGLNSYAPVRHESEVSLRSDLTFVVAASGVVSSKAGAMRDRYNRLSLLTTALRDLWNAHTGRWDSTLAAAIRSSPDSLDRLRGIIAVAASDAAELRVRLDQFAEESDVLVPGVAAALETDDRKALGALVDRSQELAERNLGNQVRETIALQRLARELGAIAASAFGAGFGGSVWALVPAADVTSFTNAWSERYRSLHSLVAGNARFFASPPGKPAHYWSESA